MAASSWIPRSTARSVARGLDPRVHRFFAQVLSRVARILLPKGMDARVTPAHDSS
jgi:hypothetical protein